MNTYCYADIETGQKESFSVRVTEETMDSFKAITGDINPLHNDSDHARNRGYEDRVVYGMLTASYLSTLAGVYLPGEKSLIQSVEIRFSKPVYIGDILDIEGEVTEKNDTFKVIILKVSIKNQQGKKVLKGSMQIGVAE